jgi:tight adherence protein C
LLTFAAVSLAAFVLLQPKNDVVGRRIRGEKVRTSASERRLEGSIKDRFIVPNADRFGAFLARFVPKNVLQDLEHMMVMSNSRMPLTIFLTMWAVSFVVGCQFFWYVSASNSDMSPAQMVLLALFTIGLFTLMPYLWLRRRVKKRQKQITRALPDALDLLVTGVEAGLGVDAAFAMVTDKTSGPLSETLTLYLRQIGLGRPRRDAFLDVAERTGVTDLIRVAASVAQAEQMGAVLGDVLRMQASDLRILRRQRAQEAAQRAPVLMTIPMASCFLPAMGAVIIIPSILNLGTFFSRVQGGPGIVP